MPTLLAIAIAGALGALARYGLDGVISSRGSLFPWGTFVINITGSFVLGALFTVFTGRLNVQPWLRSGITTGFLGAYTTFSTLMLESSQLISEGSWTIGALNVVGSMAAGLIAVFAGVFVGRWAS